MLQKAFDTSTAKQTDPLWCAIMQPTYLPWSGYFNLIARVKHFVFLDDVQYERQSWQCQNRILRQKAAFFLRLPVIKSPLNTKIEDILVDGTAWRKAHRDLVWENYRISPYIDQVMVLFDDAFLEDEQQHLADINISLIKNIATALALPTRFVRARDLACGGRRSEHLDAICRKLGATDYLSPQGSAAYLGQDGFTKFARARLHFQQFEPIPYPQIGDGQFVSYLSIIDQIAHLGLAATRAYVTGETNEVTSY
ncbi:WbqC family protein [Vogesella fluminis]|uniref:WbqC family protein n=1 Tax=Vogesella fluminis TaxID=1069161 RepID=A0ABQ3HAQ0_9NEIS|nr:WbqC family protein [Vogesella fluminis]GHD79189.1 hypothetical protein GCM10011419_22230 [Vogesella fluminis]